MASDQQSSFVPFPRNEGAEAGTEFRFLRKHVYACLFVFAAVYAYTGRLFPVMRLVKAHYALVLSAFGRSNSYHHDTTQFSRLTFPLPTRDCLRTEYLY